jgi:hypothetical protein
MTASDGSSADDISVAASTMPTLGGTGKPTSLGEADKLDLDDKRSATTTLDDTDSGVIRASAAIKEIDESAVFAHGEDKYVLCPGPAHSTVPPSRPADAQPTFLSAGSPSTFGRSSRPRL